jgi:transposase
MAMNFIGCDREQGFLMPPSLREWVPEDHLVWTVLDAVAEMDLGALYGSYRADGHGRPAYEPSMMVAPLLYAYARGNRSSRAIERACVEDVAYRVVAGHLVPDHSTIAEFRVRHEAALAELFTGVLGLCRRAGLVSVGVVAIDGTKVRANASRDTNRSYEQVAREILAEAAEIDRREDELYGEARGDELPERLRTSAGRRAALREAGEALERERASKHDAEVETGAAEGVAIGLDPERFVTRGHGRRAWFREARRALDERRAVEARPVRAHVPRGLRSRRCGWRRSFRSSGRRTRPTRPGASAGSLRTARAGWLPVRPSPTGRRSCRRGRSTRRTLTRGSSRRSASGRCRATARRRRSTSTRSWWPPR